jgi:RNA polymerase-binding transcription factor DksA
MDHPMETREEFDMKAKAEGWACTGCDKPIRFEDREAYLESTRCSRCHQVIDPDSGPISPSAKR